MSWKNASEIQSALGIELPQWFCQFAEKNYDRLQKLLVERFYGDAASLIQNNLEYRTNSTGLPETFPEWWKSYLLLGDNCAGDWTCIRVNGSEDRKLVIITTNGCDESTYEEDTEDYFDEMFEYFRRGYDYGSYMPLPEQLILQQEITSPLHRQLMGKWIPHEPNSSFHVSMEYRVNVVDALALRTRADKTAGAYSEVSELSSLRRLWATDRRKWNTANQALPDPFGFSGSKRDCH